MQPTDGAMAVAAFSTGFMNGKTLLVSMTVAGSGASANTENGFSMWGIGDLELLPELSDFE